MKARDRVIGIFAFVVVAVVAGLVVTTVLDAQDRGRLALERNQAATVRQLAAGMEQRFGSTLESFLGLAQQPLTFGQADPADHAVVQRIQDLVPDAQSGMLLMSPDRTLTNGTLLRDPSLVGSVVDRPGLAELIESGKPGILPAAPGLTTDALTLAIAAPIPDDAGKIKGVFVFESVIAVDSDFNKEIAALRGSGTGSIIFTDSLGTVIVANDPDLLGRPFAETGLKEADLEGADVTREGSRLRRVEGRVVATAAVPSADWRLVFSQDEEDFEAGLGERVQTALLMIILAGLVAGAVAFAAVLRRLRAERIERRRIEQINATREEFVSIVSHELRTPVAGVLGFLQSTLDHWDALDEDARRHAVRRACSNAQRLQALTRDVLDTSNVEAGDLTYSFDIVNLASEIDASVLAARDLDPARLVSFEAPRETAWVRADPDRIQQVMMNLLDNALKNSPRDRPVSVDLRIEGHDAVVTVTDQGAGLAESEVNTIFEKWVRGRSSVYGSGLGLYLAREIVRAHHGRIWAEPRPEGGARFGFAVPLAPTTADTPVS